MYVQSLYRNCLLYLRKNPKYINFTILNETIVDDLIKIIKDEEYLRWSPSKKYCIVYDHDELNHHAIIHHRKTWTRMHYIPSVNRQLEIVGYSSEYKFYNTIYDTTVVEVNGIHYQAGLRLKSRSMPNETFKKFFSDIYFDECEPEYCLELVLESSFDKYPGLLKLAREHGAVSETLEIPKHYFEN